MGELAAILNAMVWALTGVITKGVGKNVRPTHIVAAQVWIGLTFLLIVGLIIGQLDELIHVQLRSAIYLAGGALINTAGSLVFWLALSRSTVSKVYPTTQSIFIIVSVLTGWLFLDDSPEPRVFGGAALIIGGVILLNWRPAARTSTAPGNTATRPERGGGDYLGIGLAVATAFLWAGGFLSTVVGLEDTPPVAAATIRNLVPAIIFVAVSIAFPATRVSRVFRGNGIRLTVGALLFAFSALSFVVALDLSTPGVVVVLINTSPMWAVVLAAFVLRERLTRFAIGGAALSLAGIFVTLAFR
ncbi:MAG: EamA family transporter [Chloroflexi bacterium]|nr:EamA family transporter [Chloroflexota bacterium]